MERRSYAFFTGCFVLVLSLVGAGLLWWLGRPDVDYQPYAISADFSVAGVNPHSRVLLRGVPVGRVTSIGFDPKNQARILMEVEIDASVRLTTRSYATLRPQGVTGLAQVMLDQDAGPAEPLTTSAADPARIPMRQGVLERILGNAEALMDDAATVLDNLAQLSSEENAMTLQRILANVETASGELVQLQEEVGGLPTEARKTLEQARRYITGLERLNPLLRQLVSDSGATARRGAELVEELEDTALPQVYVTLDDISLAARDIRRLAQSLRQDPQSLLFGTDGARPGPGEPGYRGETP